MNKNIRSVIVLAVVAAVGWYALSRHTAIGPNEPVATVNGESITRGQLTAQESQFAAQQGLSATSTEAQAQFQSVALESLIGQTLLKQAAQKAGITASSTIVASQIASAKASFSTLDEYKNELAARGMTEDILRTNIGINLILNEYLERQLHLSAATSTDAEIKTLYDQVSAQQAGNPVPPLSQVRDQIAQMVVQQKQRERIDEYVAQLRKTADVKILIATSTPAA